MKKSDSISLSKYIILIVILGAIAFVAGIWLGHSQQKPLAEQVKVATVLPQGRVLSAFQLKNSNGQPFNNQSLVGHWTFLFFGFTNCPNICPTTMATLSEMYKKLAAENQQPMPQIALISLDPKRDTLSVLQKYVTAFNPAFQGATGNNANLDKLTKELSILYMKIAEPGADPDDYQIDHSGTLFLIDPKGDLSAIFSMPHDADSIATDYATIANH